jgi:Tfp pilus assembly protein PilN
MFTIDLLKGEGLPAKARAQNMAVAAIASAVPFVIAVAMFGFYLQNRIVISIQAGEIAACKEKTDKLSGAVAKQRALEQNKTAYGACLAEVKTTVERHTQWSPILATVVGNMPESVVLTALEVKDRTVKRKVPNKDDPETTTEVSVPAPTLQMNVAATPQSDGDKAVRAFRDKLQSSDLLGPRLESITVSQRADKLSGLDVVSYEINCLFKPKL